MIRFHCYLVILVLIIISSSHIVKTIPFSHHQSQVHQYQESLLCSNELVYLSYIQPLDISWLEYVISIYGILPINDSYLISKLYKPTDYHNHKQKRSINNIYYNHKHHLELHQSERYDYTLINSIIPKSSITFYYRNDKIRIQPLDWDRYNGLPMRLIDIYVHGLRTRSTKVSPYRAGYHSNEIYRDHSWIEVNRFESSTWDEGLSHGMQRNLIRNNHSQKVPYGCWAWASKGSGIFVNIGKSLVIPEKVFPITIFEELNKETGCIQGDPSTDCFDKYLCTVALRRGYDSIQISKGSEIIICNGLCANTSYQDACSVMELRTGYQASKPCHCNPALPIVNCIGELLNQSRSTTTDIVQNDPAYSPFHPKYISNYSEYENYRPVACVSTTSTNATKEAAASYYQLSIGFTSGIAYQQKGFYTIVMNISNAIYNLSQHLLQSSTQPSEDTVSSSSDIFHGQEVLLLDIGSNARLSHLIASNTFLSKMKAFGYIGFQLHYDDEMDYMKIVEYQKSKIHKGVESHKNYNVKSSRLPFFSPTLLSDTSSEEAVLPLLSINIDYIQSSMLYTKKNIKIGFIGFNDPPLTTMGPLNPLGRKKSIIDEMRGAEELLGTLVRQIVDEANCLRTMGASLVVLVGGGDNTEHAKEILHYLRIHLYTYIDIILTTKTKKSISNATETTNTTTVNTHKLSFSDDSQVPIPTADSNSITASKFLNPHYQHSLYLHNNISTSSTQNNPLPHKLPIIDCNHKWYTDTTTYNTHTSDSSKANLRKSNNAINNKNNINLVPVSIISAKKFNGPTLSTITNENRVNELGVITIVKNRLGISIRNDVIDI